MDIQKQIQELDHQRLKLNEKRKEMVEQAEAADRDFTPEEDANFTQLVADDESLKRRRDRLYAEERNQAEAALAVEKTTDLARHESGDKTISEGEAREGIEAIKAERRAALNAWARGGMNAVTQEQRAMLNPRAAEYQGQAMSGPTFRLGAPAQVVYRNGAWKLEQRAAQTVTTTGGGHVVPDEAMAMIETAMLDYNGVRQAGAEVIRTETGADLPWPTINDTSNKGRLLAINTTVTNTALVYGQTVFKSYKFSSDSILVPIELMQDAVFDYGEHVAARLGERLGRIYNQYQTSGTGSSEPNGVKNIANAGVRTVASATAVAADEFIDLQGDLDVAYRQGAVWMWKTSTNTATRKLKDGNNNYLWAPGTGVAGLGAPRSDTFLGDRVQVNDEMRAIGADKRPVIYGNFTRGYKIREVMDVTLLRLVERYADDGQVGFVAFSRMDAGLLDAGTQPLVCLRNPAS